MRRSIYEMNYERLARIIPGLAELQPGDVRTLTAPGFMDLNVECVGREGNGVFIALSHYYKHPSGDMIPDPDMAVMVYHRRRMVEALSYRDSFGFKAVYSDEARTRFYPRRKTELNAFLGTWLRNIERQGHKLAVAPEAA